MYRLIVVAAIVIGLRPTIGIAGSLEQDSAWTPPVPAPKEKDWIQLTSGEWLRGDVKYLTDESFVFDSQELDELTLDWEDIKEIRSPRILTYYFQDIGTFVGTATMKDSVIAIRIGGEVKEFPRSQLLSIIEGEPTELNFWSGKISAGVVTRSGNTNQEDFNTILFVRRQTTRTRLDVNYKGNYGRVDDELNINNHDATAKFDLLIAAGFFVTPAFANLYGDRFQNISLRSTFGAGLGYFLVRSKKTEWNVKLNGGHQSTRYLSVEAGQSDRESGGVIIPATSLDIDLTGALELIVDYSATIDLTGGKNNFMHASALFSLDAFGDVLELTFAITLDRAANPQPAADGRVPDRNDYRTNIGIGIDF